MDRNENNDFQGELHIDIPIKNLTRSSADAKDKSKHFLRGFASPVKLYT